MHSLMQTRDLTQLFPVFTISAASQIVLATIDGYCTAFLYRILFMIIFSMQSTSNLTHQMCLFIKEPDSIMICYPHKRLWKKELSFMGVAYHQGAAVLFHITLGQNVVSFKSSTMVIWIGQIRRKLWYASAQTGVLFPTQRLLPSFLGSDRRGTAAWFLLSIEI